MARKRKKPAGKKINPTLFVFCEGETEVSYINLLKTVYRIPSIQIHPRISKNNITSKYIRNYKKGKPTHEKDLDFLFYDLDAPAILQRLSRIDDYTLLVSNPSVELWFLLHFKNQTANASTAYCCKELKNRNGLYKKGSIDYKLKEKLTNRIDIATKRAKKLTEFENPSSTVYILLEVLNNLKK